MLPSSGTDQENLSSSCQGSLPEEGTKDRTMAGIKVPMCLQEKQSLICIPRTGERRDPLAGKFERTSGNVTIVLSGQPACASQPTYGLNTIICGNLNFRKPDEVAEVVIKLTWQNGNGHIESWSKTGRPVLRDLSSLESAMKYSVLIASKQKLGGLISKNKKFVIPFTYAPRMRPFRPIIDNPNFLETVKTAPDEWTEIPSELQLKDNSTPGPCQQAIPFHIQLSGSVATLSEFLPPSYCNPRISLLPQRRQSEHFLLASQEPTLRVSLLRQVVANIREGEAVFKNVRIGEGKLQPLPQVRDECSEGLCEIALGLDREVVKVDSEVLHGGFKTGELTIKDFIVLTVTAFMQVPI
ncbi:hypothetical protein DL96DRAFT_1786917 [Flagelloscypha sp. PMI_526]|nr:hypothetical protein DL96DRAFT_1786917 [Flagelloscypha sp. PMI_526]